MLAQSWEKFQKNQQTSNYSELSGINNGKFALSSGIIIIGLVFAKSIFGKRLAARLIGFHKKSAKLLIVKE